ncbi:MAG: alpha/beta hydrolase [Chitinophagaceae bacterium]|nr:alpha/beta hydrolase [Chitinophagaceae bacterium]
MSPQLEQWKSLGKAFEYKNHHIFFRDEGDGEVLLILHGYPFNTFDFKDIWPYLTTRFRVIAPDMLGMGFSDKPSDYEYSFDNHTEIFLSLLSTLQVKKVHILAHDLGNSVAQELLARNEEGKLNIEIKSIAFLNGGLFTDVYKPRVIQILLSKSPAFFGKLLSKLISKRSIDKATAEVFGIYTKPTTELHSDFWDILNFNNGKLLSWKIGRLVFSKEPNQPRWISAMQNTRVPMCFINGPSDPNSGLHMAKRYQELIPNPNVILLSQHIGHWPQIEAPAEVVQALKKFYNTLN